MHLTTLRQVDVKGLAHCSCYENNFVKCNRLTNVLGIYLLSAQAVYQE